MSRDERGLRAWVVACMTASVCSITLSGCCCIPFDTGDEDAEQEASAEEQAAAAPAKTRGGSAAPSDDPPPARAGRRDAEVDAVWFNPAKKTGGTSPVSIRVEATPGGKPAVAVMEQHVEGTGNMWQAAAWIAAFNASRLTGHHLGDHEFIVKSSGFIDGPSAGMLMTAAMIALIRGDAIREDATMTGTINPDGTAGPVGGIPQKIQGAAEKGKTRFGFPMGTQRSTDLATGRTVDLVAFAEKHGVTATEVTDVYDAYTLLTGEELPRPTMATEGDMALGSDVEAFMKQRIEDLSASITRRLTAAKKARRGLPPQAIKLQQPMMNLAVERFQAAEALAKKQDLPNAYLTLRQAATLLHIGVENEQVTGALLRLDFKKALRKVQGLRDEIDRDYAALSQAIDRTANTGTIGGQVNAVNAFISCIMAQSYKAMGDQYVAGVIQRMQQFAKNPKSQNMKAVSLTMGMLTLPMQYYAMAKGQIEVAREQLKAGLDEGGTSSPNPEKMLALASAYSSAAGAGLYNIEALVLEPQADRLGISDEEATKRFTQNDITYALARQAARNAQAFSQQMDRGSTEYAMINLAASSYSYGLSAELVNKYYALDMDPKTQRVTNPRVMVLQLEKAREQARANAGACKDELGFIPAAARLEYQLAVSLASSSDDQDRMRALNAFWMASFWSELAMNLA